MPGYHEHQPETEEYGITSFVYNRKLPFHSERFYQLMYTLRKNVVRVKGIAWCATRNNLALSVSQAGPSISIEPVSYWVACLQESEQKQIIEEKPHVMEEWNPEFGDRKTQLVFIGTGMNEREVSAELDFCLLTGGEFDGDSRALNDPFKWNIPERAR